MSGKKTDSAPNGPRLAESVDAEPAGGRSATLPGWAAGGFGRLAKSVKKGLNMQWAATSALAVAAALAVAPPAWGWQGFSKFAGLALLSFLLIRVLLRAWVMPGPGFSPKPKAKDLVFLALLFFLVALFTRGYFMFCQALAGGPGGIDLFALGFAAPLGMGPLLAALFLGARVGMLTALGLGFLVALMWPDAAGMFCFFLLTGVVACHRSRGVRTRMDLISAGARSAWVGLLAVLGLALYRDWVISAEFPAALAAAALGGCLSGVLAAGLAPLIEMLFSYTTDAKYLEQASLDHPALRELMLRAPGTYHHSLVVGSLVEAAAREIGANHLLARVAALYHDIGKVKKADYFVENQKGGPSRHEKLAPSMSSLILTSHVKEGVELATQYRLSRPIIDIMAQHHGTRVIHFFYNKAVECRKKAGQPEPDQEAFRYPGPRPQSREAALVMLADTIEAACRSLDNPTPARIKGVVQTEINKIFTEGQLDECELTLKDLHMIAKSFNNILIGIFHQRVEYPQGEEKAKKRDGDSNRQQGGAFGKSTDQDAEPDSAGIRRLGLLR